MTHKLLKPQALKEGSTIGICAFASPLNKKVYSDGLQHLHQCDFKSKVVLSPVFANYKHLYSTAPAPARAKALERLFNAKDVDAIMSVRGGYGSAQMLPHLDFAALRRRPKIFMGFSDLTAVLNNLYQRSGLVCFHGPSMITYGAKALNGNAKARRSLGSLDALLKGKIINPFEKCRLKKVCGKSGSAAGRLIGGNLSILISLMGTPWDVDFKDHILFLEEVSEAPYRVHRMLLQLKLAGKFRRLKAVVLGDFLDGRKEINAGEPTYAAIFRDIFKGANFPVLSGLPVGHADLNLPVPIGVRARINQNRLEILEPAVIS